MSDERRGLFLDLDGTLADSLPIMRQIYDRFLSLHGAMGCDREFDSLNGPALDQVVAELRRSHGLSPSIEDLVETYQSMIEEDYLSVPPARGAEALVEAANARDWAVAVVTSNSGRRTERWLERHGLRHRVEVIVGGDGDLRSKPDPAPYLLALQRCGCRSDRSLAVEDSRAGADAAVSAGLATYVLASRPADTAGWPGIAGFIESLDQLITAL